MLKRCLVSAAVIGWGCALLACGSDGSQRTDDGERFLTAGDGGRAPAACPHGDLHCAAEGGSPSPASPAEPPKDAGPTCDYANTCDNAIDLGSIAGDDGSETKDNEGSTSRWLGIRATEKRTTTAFAHPMKVTAELTVPAGTNYDLYMYLDTGKDDVSCSEPTGKGTNLGNAAETLEIAWGETGTLTNDKDDSRSIRFEVRHVSGSCDPGATWKLTVSGNK